MNAAKATEVETLTHQIRCATDGCLSVATGAARVGEANAEARARIKARQQALEAGWQLRGSGAAKRWTCPRCYAREVREDFAADHHDRTLGAERRMLIRASTKAREAVERKRVLEDKAEKRRTKPVGDKVAKADSTLTRETPKLIFSCEFDRVVVRHLLPRQVTAADEWRRRMEEAQGVSDREVFRDKVDNSAGSGGPDLSQLAALQWRAKVGTIIGHENVRILDMAIMQDLTPREVGQFYCSTKDVEKRAMVGMAFVKAALTQLADYMGLRR